MPGAPEEAQGDSVMRIRTGLHRRPAYVAAALCLLWLTACSGGGASPTAGAGAGVPVIGPPGTMLEKAGPYEVLRVIDGDSLAVDRGRGGGHTFLRLAGVEAPEDGAGGRCYGSQATAEARRLLDGQVVRIVADPNGELVDRSGRLVVYVWLDSGRMLNHLMLENGFVREHRNDGVRSVYWETFGAAEERAREAQRGLWSPDTCSGNTTRPVEGVRRG